MNKRVRGSAFKKHLLTFSLMAGGGVLFACGGTQHVDTPRTQLSVPAAQAQLVWSLGGLWGRTNVRDVKFTRRKVTFKADRDQKFTDGSVGKTEEFTLLFSSYTKLAYEKAGMIADAVSDVTADGQFVQRFSREAYAAGFVDAMVTLRDASSTDTEAADFAAFTVAAQAWLATTPKPAMSDEARGYKLLAEDALKRKDFSAALEAYRTALTKDPMWPEGQYNAALLAAEAEDYELAANYMRRYLVLAPDAKDAASARDNLLVWQLKAKQ